jgi:Flp pilus assembly protein TadG
VKSAVSPAGRQRGVAAVEFGLVIGLLAVIVFGITELGRAMFQYEALTKSARSAARYLAVFDASDPVVRASAQCLAVYGNPDCSATGLVPVVPGLTVSHVAILEPTTTPALQSVETGQGSLDLVAVTIGSPATPYQFQSLIPAFIPHVTFGPISAAMPQSFF